MSLPIIAPTPTKSLIGYAVKVITQGNFNATLTLHRVLKEIDPAWPYQIDPDHKKKVTLNPAVKYTAEHLSSEETMDKAQVNLETYLFYEPMQVGLITATYVKEVAEWIDQNMVGRDEDFQVTIEFLEITEQNKTTWFYGYGEDLFTLKGNESLAEEVSIATEHFAVPSSLDVDDAADYEVLLLTGAHPDEETDEKTDELSTTPTILEATICES